MSSYHESLAGKILVVSIILVSVVVVFVFFVHLYANWFWYRRQQLPDTRHRRRRGDFTAGHQELQSGITVLRRGLDASFLKTIPVIVFDPKDFKEGLECTVCLSELGQGEKARILPKCSHGFHMECIDMWFHSHSTCPICRNPVSHQTEISVENLLEIQQESTESSDSQEFPTNILFWGDETEVSTLTSQLEEANQLTSSPSSSQQHTNRPDLVIDIPSLIDEEDVVDQKTAVSSRMRSLRRILSGSSRFMNPFSPPASSTSLEQGSRGRR